MKYDLIGYNANNLIKTLVTKKIKIFNLTFKSKTEFSFEIKDKDVKRARRYIANFKIKQTLTKFKRFPAILLANLGLILACFLGTIFYIFSSAYTWQIQVFGTENLTKQAIIQVLAHNNVKVGKINLVSGKEIENILLNNYDRIAQVSVIKNGTAIIINLSEKLVYNNEEYKPIVAKASGIITDIKLIAGTSNVKIGDFVNCGDVLVLPFNINTDGEKINVKPMAEITAKIYIIGRCQLNKTETKLVRTGRSVKTYEYKFKNLNLFSGKSKNSFALFESVVYNESVSGLVPFSRKVCVFYELEQVEIQNNLAEHKQEIEQKSLNLAKSKLVSGSILEENTTTDLQSDCLISISTITVLGLIHD